jgi:hypothetical protein
MGFIMLGLLWVLYYFNKWVLYILLYILVKLLYYNTIQLQYVPVTQSSPELSKYLMVQ